MRIDKISIRNFRSINNRCEIKLEDLTVLIGPNNEGKSNILAALMITLNSIRRTWESSMTYDRNRRRYLRKTNADERKVYQYDWPRDFPIEKQRLSKEPSEFIVSFNLTKSEATAFKNITKYKLKSNFGIKQLFYKPSLPTAQDSIEPYDGKKLIKSLDNKKGFKKIGKFMGKIWNYQFIPTIRTPSLAIANIEDIIEHELSKLENSKEYPKFIKKIEELQKPILDSLSKELTKNMKLFLPTVKKIRLISKNQVRRLVRQACQIYINDGVETKVEMKGDGIKSLLAISVLHNSIIAQSKDNTFFGLEEPESHLHPKAVHRLKEVIEEMSESNQVIITTHSPIFVDRMNVKRNILVNEDSIKPAKSIQEIRESLGVEISDNLKAAKYILLVEGEEDLRILKVFLMKSDKIKKSLISGVLQIEPMYGVAKLTYFIRQFEMLLCNICVYLDNDDEAREAFKKAFDLNLIKIKNVFFTNFPGYKNSEMEDLIKKSIYKDKIKQDYGVNLEGGKFRNNKYKWSERVKKVFQATGKPWDDTIEKNIKNTVATCVETNGVSSILKQGKGSINSLVEYLEKIISK